MYSRRRMLRIIDDLKALDALLMVVWDRNSPYPRVWLREWCGAKTSVSIGTARVIRDQILAGNIRPRPIRTQPVIRRLPAPCGACIETDFV